MVASGKYWLLKAHFSHSSTSAFLVSLAGPGLGGFLPSGMFENSKGKENPSRTLLELIDE